MKQLREQYEVKLKVVDLYIASTRSVSKALGYDSSVTEEARCVAARGLDWRITRERSLDQWLKTVLDNVVLHNLTLPEAIDMAQNRRRLLAASGATHS